MKENRALTQRHLQADLCIVGGGMAGVCAALAAARNGIEVVLIQNRSVLGGSASSEIRMHIVGASCSGRRPGARESGIIEELRLEDAMRNPHRSPHLFDLLLYDKIISDKRIQLLLDTDCVGCELSGKSIAQVRAVCNMTEEEFLVEAPFFLDSSGDGRLGIEAGADYRMGRESSREYDESLAPSEADGFTLGSTILFMARKHDHPVPFKAPSWARRFSEKDLAWRSHRELEYGYWWVEWGGHLDTVKDNGRIRHELLRIALGVWDHVKNRCPRDRADSAAKYDKWREDEPGQNWQSPANWALEWIGALPGKRESRRFLGPSVLTQKDVMEGRIWPDQVAYGGWWIDLHPPHGIDAVHEYPCEQHEVPHLYSIPLTCLFSRNVPNLFFAGRNISATHVAFASTRVMATCSLLGQAVGTAAARAVRAGLKNIDELLSHDQMEGLQQELLRDDCFLLGVTNRDSGDLALKASISTSGSVEASPAESILNGIGRATEERLHPALSNSTNQWISDQLPAWIELSWPRPQTISAIHLTFDTGFQRELTLTMSDAYNDRMIRGPQPETVSEYEISDASRDWKIRVKDNYLRKRIHHLPDSIRTSKVRLDLLKTHGSARARLFEIRIY